MPQPKDKDWLNGYKNKTSIYAVYKRPTSKQYTYRLKVKGWKKIFHIQTKSEGLGKFHAYGNQKKSRSRNTHQIKQTLKQRLWKDIKMDTT